MAGYGTAPLTTKRVIMAQLATPWAPQGLFSGCLAWCRSHLPAEAGRVLLVAETEMPVAGVSNAQTFVELRVKAARGWPD